MPRQLVIAAVVTPYSVPAGVVRQATVPAGADTIAVPLGPCVGEAVAPPAGVAVGAAVAPPPPARAVGVAAGPAPLPLEPAGAAGIPVEVEAPLHAPRVSAANASAKAVLETRIIISHLK
jgi:hypothetical protein